MTPDLPTGIVTFLFTDIEGSTSLWEREPGRMQPALERHNAILSQAVAALVLVYFSSVVLLQALVGILTGQRQLAVVTVLSTLALAAAFGPLRRRVQDFIDRRFYRRKYDAARTLASFAVAARDEVDLDRLSAQLVAVVDDTMQPERVSLWLRKGRS